MYSFNAIWGRIRTPPAQARQGPRHNPSAPPRRGLLRRLRGGRLTTTLPLPTSSSIGWAWPLSPASGRPASASAPSWPCANISNAASTTKGSPPPATSSAASCPGPPKAASSAAPYGSAIPAEHPWSVTFGPETGQSRPERGGPISRLSRAGGNPNPRLPSHPENKKALPLPSPPPIRPDLCAGK